MLRIRIEPDRTNIEQHAKKMLTKAIERSNMPMIPSLDEAVFPGYCEDCENRLWVRSGAHHYICDDCKEKREEDREKEKEHHEGLMVRLMSTVRNDGMTQH